LPPVTTRAAHVERHVRTPVRAHDHGSGIGAVDPAVLRQPGQQDTVAPLAQAVEDDAPARSDEARGSAVDGDTEAVGIRIGAAGGDGHFDPAVGGDVDEGFAAGGERQDRERNEKLEAGPHGNLPAPKHLAASWRLP